jgi:hypothetical protein
MGERKITYDSNIFFKRYKNNQNHINDVIFGGNSENKIKPLLEKHFNLKFEYTNGFNTFDFYNQKERIYIELKSRRNTKYKYPTTMISYNKYMESIKYLKSGKAEHIYFCFNFTDKLCIYKLNPKDKFINKIGGTSRRGINEYKPHIFIPVKILTDIN